MHLYPGYVLLNESRGVEDKIVTVEGPELINSRSQQLPQSQTKRKTYNGKTLLDHLKSLLLCLKKHLGTNVLKQKRVTSKFAD
jgi:hypothetical protein